MKPQPPKPAEAIKPHAIDTIFQNRMTLRFTPS
jgi:hypothetical protein